MKHKIRPSLPNKEWIVYGKLDDDCYGCKNKHNCRNCRRAKRIVAEEKESRMRKEKQKLCAYRKEVDI